MMRFGRSVTGRIRETIGASLFGILVSGGGLVDTGGQAEGLLGTETTIAHSGHIQGAGAGPQGILTVRPELLIPFAGEWAA